MLYKGSWACLLGLALVALPPLIHAQDIVISEIMFNPAGDENACEFVELVNRGDNPVSLEDYEISDGESADILIPVDGIGRHVMPGGYALIVDPDYFDSPEKFPVPDGMPLFTVEDRAIGNRGLSNSVAEPVMLLSGSGDTLSQVRYNLDTPPGHSWERVLPESGDQPLNFAPSLAVGGTPGAPNSVLPQPFDPALDNESVVIDSESAIYGGSIAVSLSYLNTGRDTTSQVFMLLTLPPNPPVAVSFDTPVTPGERSQVRHITLAGLPGGMLTLEAVITAGNTIDTANDTLRQSIPVPIGPGVIILNEAMPAPPDGEMEWAELLNTGDWPVVLDGFRIGDSGGAVSGMVSAQPVIPPGGFGIMAASAFNRDVPEGTPVAVLQGFPVLNNDGDTIRLLDWTGSVLDSVVYERTEPGLSLELISPELHGTPDGWDICVDPYGATPGLTNSIDYPPLIAGGGDNDSRPELQVEPNPFGELTTITYRLPFPLARTRLQVYDRRGRLVATLRDTQESGSEWSDEWDGRNDGHRLPAGPYILNLEALDKRSGKTHTQRTVIVIGSQL